MRNFDEELKTLLVEEFQSFKTVIGDNAIKKAMVIILRKRGLTYGQISTRLDISRQWAHTIYTDWHNSTVTKEMTE